MNDLQKSNLLINEINSISNWPTRNRFIVYILSSGFLPAIITIIFKSIEVFVLN